MTYKEAQEKALTVYWKAGLCSEGEKCWCRTITTVEPIFYDDIEEYYIASSGAIPRLEAEHLVEIHNKSLYNF